MLKTLKESPSVSMKVREERESVPFPVSFFQNTEN